MGMTGPAASEPTAGAVRFLGRRRDYWRLLTRGAEKASPDEIEANQRAASVRLRAAERVRQVAA